MPIAAVVSTIAELARGRALEAELRRREADLAAELARELLAGERTEARCGRPAHRVAEALETPLGGDRARARHGPPASRRVPTARRRADSRSRPCWSPRRLSRDTVERLHTRVVPPLEALIDVALHRDAAQAEAVETAALRRSDELKTALLQTISHDLRTPVTAILAAGHALGHESVDGRGARRAERRGCRGGASGCRR